MLAMFVSGDILIPKTDLTKWCVVACDQHTSSPAYWEAVRQGAGDAPSALQVIFPEVYLGKVDFEAAIAAINSAMEQYLADDIFTQHHGMVYCRRTLANGTVRQGVVGLLDLQCYDFGEGAKPPVRATEGTVLDRIPPRVRVREHAAIELPHVMLLADDPAKTAIEPLAAQQDAMQKLYSVQLMQGGGSIEGWLMSPAQVESLQAALAALVPQGEHPLALAVGDGNHSLATARECYRRSPTPRNRYAMVELCNLHDASLVFQPIHRTVFGVDPHAFVAALARYCKDASGGNAAQSFTVVSPHSSCAMEILHPACNLAVGSVQQFLDSYTAAHGGTVDYIHGEDEARALVAQDAVSILLPTLDKAELFPTVIKDGALPRKTFSMGEAQDKRYYLECRKIRE